MKTLFKLLILTVLPLSLFAFHDHHKHDKKTQVQLEDEKFYDPLLNSTEEYLKYLYDKINLFSKALDESITNEPSDHIYDKSAIHFETYYDAKESKDDDIGVNFNVKLRLPQLQEKFKLFIENSDDKAGRAYDDNNEKKPYEDDDFNIGLEYDKLKKYYNFRTKAGVKLNSDPYVFINAKVSKKFDLTSSWDLNLEEKIELNTENNFENSTSASLYKRINGRYSFGNYNEYYWDEKNQDDNIYNSVRFLHKLSQRDSLNYVTSLSSNDDNSGFKTKEYKAYVAYKHYIRKWLYYDVVPGMFWERDDNFETKYSFKFNIGIIVGK